MDLDLKDRKILYELDLNSRQPNSLIGKKVGLKKDSVAYRINRLVKKNIITGFITKIDALKLNYDFYNVFLKYKNINLNQQKKIINYIVNSKKIGWAVDVLGDCNLVFLYLAKSDDDFFNFWKVFLSKFGSFIERKEISKFYREINCPKLFLLNKNTCDDKDFLIVKKTNKIVNFDKIDLKILSLMSVNSRITTVELSKNIGLTPKSIIYRINKLKEKGIILGFGISIDYRKLNFEYYKLEINFKNFTEIKYNKFINFCKYNKYIIFIDECIGGNDIKLNIYIENKIEYRNLLDNILYEFSDIIKDMKTLQYYKELKYNLFPVVID